jgi:hypothetical protein
MSKTNSITYTTNKEYRKAVREFCKMNCVETENTDDTMDEETKDELLYDSLGSQMTMNQIYEKTKDHPLWQKIYEKSAAKFFSTDREIGLSILFCYDFFPGFYDCWHSFLECPEKFDETNEWYEILYNTL